MDDTRSVLVTAVKRARAYLDETSSKYTNDDIVQHFIMPQYVYLMDSVNKGSHAPILLRHTITTVQDQMYYDLPPNVGVVWMVGRYDDSEYLWSDFVPRSEFNPAGPGWRIEGNVLSFRPLQPSGNEWVVVYEPNGDFFPHYADGGGTNHRGIVGVGSLTSSGTSSEETPWTVQLASDPSLGLLDTRPQAYAGAVLRVLKCTHDSGHGHVPTEVVEERVIESYDEDTRVVTLRRPLTKYAEGDIVAYEVVPQPWQHQSVASALAAAAALEMGVSKKISQVHHQKIQQQLKHHMGVIRNFYNGVQARRGKFFEGGTREGIRREGFMGLVL
jgi:hypothetical protein